VRREPSLEVTVPPAGPRTPRGERTWQRVRGAARRTFADRGYAASRVEDIVALAEVSHGTFYTYFDNKAAVLDALIDDTAAELQAVVDEPWEGPDGSAAVAAVIERFVTVFVAHGDVVRVWLAASATEAHFRDRLREVRAGYVRRVAEVLAPVLDGSAHRPADVAAALVAMVEGYATEGLTADSLERRREVVHTLSTLWLGGLVRLTEDRPAH
jgi:AcrR family transcriptional regulator